MTGKSILIFLLNGIHFIISIIKIYYGNRMSFILDILYFLGFYGIEYFCAKKLTKKTDAIPLDFSLSNKAILFGLGGAFCWGVFESIF